VAGVTDGIRGLGAASFFKSVSFCRQLDACFVVNDSSRMFRALIWPFAFAAMDDAGAAAFGAWAHVKSVSDITATAIMTDHAWPLNLDSGVLWDPITTVLRSDGRIRLGDPPRLRA